MCVLLRSAWFSCLLLILYVSAARSSPELPEDTAEFAGEPFNDRSTAVGEYPSYVFIRTETRQRCGGAVIDERHIVTLAQCVLDGNFHVFNPRLVRVFAGDLLWFPASATRQTRLASVIYVHPNFKAHTLENDIAVIRASLRSVE